MMKKTIPVLLLTVTLTGCDKPQHVSGAEFKREFELRDQQTLFWAEYLGEKDGKVFLRRKRAPLIGRKWKEEIWYTETENLDADFLDELRKERAKLVRSPAGDVPKAAPQE